MNVVNRKKTFFLIGLFCTVLAAFLIAGFRSGYLEWPMNDSALSNPEITKTTPTITAVPGTITSRDGDTISIRLVNAGLIGSPELAERLVHIDAKTEIVSEQRLKDASAYEAEFNAYTERIRILESSREGEAELKNLVAPSRYLAESSTVEALTENMLIVVFTREDVLNEKSFNAYKILIPAK